MRTIERTGQFKRDYKRESKGQHRKGLDEALVAVLELLLADKPLPAKYRDHPLAGDWSDHRDCHIKPVNQRPKLSSLATFLGAAFMVFEAIRVIAGFQDVAMMGNAIQ